RRPRPPPSAPRFPYTTLFRSLQRRGDRPEPLRKLAARVAVGMVTVPIVLGSVGFIATSGFNLTFGRTGDFGKEPFLMNFIWGQRDRKSTRLNSSHVAISYAVL